MAKGEMVDFVNTWSSLSEASLPPPVRDCQPIPFDWQGMMFFPNKPYSYKTDKADIKARGLQTLNFCFRSDKRALIVSNSLHKLSHGGHNYTDFTKSQLSDVSQWLGNELSLDFLQANLFGKIEIGVNIEHPNPKQVYTSQNRYKGNLAIPMLGTNKQYGTQFLLGAYKVKTYDPLLKLKLKKENNIPVAPNLIRFEINTSISYLRKRGVNLYTVNDLLENDNLSKLGNILIMAAEQTRYITTLPDQMDIHELEAFALFMYSTKEQLQFVRKNQRASFYRRKKTFERLVKQHQIKDEHFTNQVKQKWDQLMNS